MTRWRMRYPLPYITSALQANIYKKSVEIRQYQDEVNNMEGYAPLCQSDVW